MKVEYIFTRDELKKKRPHSKSKEISGAHCEHRDILELVSVLKKLNIGYPEQIASTDDKEAMDNANAS